MGNEHHLKTWPQPFQDTKDGKKLFEFRKDDRNPKFKVGDILVLEEFKPVLKISGKWKGEYTGESIRMYVTLVYHGHRFGIPKGYCIMGVVKE